MASIELGLVVPSEPVLRAIVLDEVARLLTSALRRATKPIATRLGLEIQQAVQSCREYQDIAGGGELYHELGAINALSVLDHAIRNIADGVIVTSLGARRFGNGLDGGLRIEIIKDDYSEVLGVSGATFTSERGYEVDWLRWLTLEGDRIIVADHRFVPGFEERSRTKWGIMMQPGNWRIPPRYSGTASDNWITRALVNIATAAEKIVEQELQKAM